jgi:hypothetical protein
MKRLTQALCALAILGVGAIFVAHTRTSQADGVFAAQFDHNGGWIPSPTLGIHDALNGMRLRPSDAVAFEIAAARGVQPLNLPAGNPFQLTPFGIAPGNSVVEVANEIAHAINATSSDAPVSVVARRPPAMLLPQAFATDSCGDPIALVNGEIVQVQCTASRATMLGSADKVGRSVLFTPINPDASSTHLAVPIILTEAEMASHNLEGIPANVLTQAAHRYQISLIVAGGLAPRLVTSDTAIATVAPDTPLLMLAAAGE